MPTGYTAKVYSGEAVEFADFALLCARAFGAFVHMRDEPSNARPVLPKEGSAYRDGLTNARAAKNRLESLTEEEWVAEWHNARSSAHQEYLDSMGKLATVRARYQAMIEKVHAWTPPSPDHWEFKDFMLTQLRQSLASDCYELRPPAMPDLESFKANQLRAAAQSVAYYEKQVAKERERIASQSRWATQLFDSLGLPAETKRDVGPPTRCP